MNPGDWIAFAGLMIVIMSGGVSALAWLLVRLGNMDKRFGERLTRIETILELAYPEAKEAAMIVDASRRQAARRAGGGSG